MMRTWTWTDGAGVSGVVVAKTKFEAARLLNERLREEDLVGDVHHGEVEELNTAVRCVRLLTDGGF